MSGPPPAGAPAGLTFGLVLAVTTNALAALAVVTIAPRIPAELGRLELYGWLFSAYLLASLLGTVWGGGEADRRGLRVPFALGLAAFAVGLGLAGVAPSMPWVVGARALQGFAGGMVITCVYVAVQRAYPDALRPRLLALLSSAWVMPALVGPALAGVVAEAFGWRVVFLALVPVVAVVAALTLPRLGVGGGRDAFGAGADRRAVADAATVAVALGIALAVLSWAAERPDVAWATLLGVTLLGAASVVLAGARLRRLLPAGTLLLRRGLAALIAARGGFFAAFIGVEAFLALMLTDLHGLSSAATGAVIASGAISWAAGSWWQARRDPRAGDGAARAQRIRTGVLVLGAGLGLQLGALAWAGDAAAAVTVVSVVGWVAAGFGIGVAHATSSVLAFASAEGEGVAPGRVSAALQLADNVGAALVTGVGGMALSLATTLAAGTPAVSGLRLGVAAAFAVAGVAWGVSLWAAHRNARPTPATTARG